MLDWMGLLGMLLLGDSFSHLAQIYKKWKGCHEEPPLQYF